MEVTLSLQDFKAKFKFVPEKAFYMGVEREYFIADRNDRIVPRAPELLRAMQSVRCGSGRTEPLDPTRLFTYELSACQIEGRTNPCASPEELELELRTNQDILRTGMEAMGCRPCYQEVGPANMPLSIFPDPTGRYQEIVRQMSTDKLRAACSIIGTHIHIGMPDHATALRVYNRVIKYTARLCRIGDHSGGQRLRIYHELSPECVPTVYPSWKVYYDYCKENGFSKDPRCCWTLIRISVNGTIEFRMFGTTEYSGRIVNWAKECRQMCMDAAE